MSDSLKIYDFALSSGSGKFNFRIPATGDTIKIVSINGSGLDYGINISGAFGSFEGLTAGQGLKFDTEFSYVNISLPGYWSGFINGKVLIGSGDLIDQTVSLSNAITTQLVPTLYARGGITYVEDIEVGAISATLGTVTSIYSGFSFQPDNATATGASIDTTGARANIVRKLKVYTPTAGWIYFHRSNSPFLYSPGSSPNYVISPTFLHGGAIATPKHQALIVKNHGGYMVSWNANNPYGSTMGLCGNFFTVAAVPIRNPTQVGVRIGYANAGYNEFDFTDRPIFCSANNLLTGFYMNVNAADSVQFSVEFDRDIDGYVRS
jgi:hypothetical protein